MPRSPASSIAERSRRADADQDRGAGDRCLLHELERQPPLTHRFARARADARRASPADHLVHRVVSPDVLARQISSPSLVEQARRMQAAAAGEPRLAQTLRQIGEQPARSTAGRGAAGPRARRPPRARPCRTRRTTSSYRSGARRARAAGRAPRRVRGELARQPELRGRRSGPRHSRNPAASSSSLPGVRIVTATGSSVHTYLERLLDRDQSSRRRARCASRSLAPIAPRSEARETRYASGIAAGDLDD